ncbi:hypothetical protein GX50_03536 [[Emmonsia] crescens]|uniref:Uncharacterized protein n=1 Tax=[Emmonsia] crescens TaxID=73230 RepID=A0A2B7ZI24_9EURO|nr:hypothetical protein GX50_03536 [Emmonsia crescens]
MDTSSSTWVHTALQRSRAFRAISVNGERRNCRTISATNNKFYQAIDVFPEVRCSKNTPIPDPDVELPTILGSGRRAKSYDLPYSTLSTSSRS